MAAAAPSSLLLSPLLLLLLLVPLICPAASVRPAKLQGRSRLGAWDLPPTCGRIECPTYEVVDQGEGYEIRRYNSTAWTSTVAIEDISLVEATRTAFFQ